MKKTELVFILDRSGSMSGLESDTIGGYNSMLKNQKAEKGVAFVTTVLFDDEYTLVHDGVSIDQIKPLSKKEYYVRGTTALLDAVGKTVNNLIHRIKNTKKVDQADKVMFVIITDGMENSSKDYSYQKVKSLIDYQKENYGWEFVFLGANIDAIKTAASFGIDQDRAVSYHSDSIGTKLNYQVVSDLVSNVRQAREIDKSWKKDIEEDYKKRS